ncbi:hypothetical protein EDEG_00073 [Edhazardia aedis USNM 41457]|uniref:Hpc2-related domain-containing protein n=1 Tax=Edhazardia aedis (strain USNM 41457) TaxID=1003232 RepID=J9DB12_EDHAE|nr:hypothetical protein EDEG_00073 [Edhazardia aedis USNM 41457]|eukprot:EJW04956.1 hypothetical protein EDEG_00073 [Edhazardia aedis USNM 41457]
MKELNIPININECLELNFKKKIKKKRRKVVDDLDYEDDFIEKDDDELEPVEIEPFIENFFVYSGAIDDYKRILKKYELELKKVKIKRLSAYDMNTKKPIFLEENKNFEIEIKNVETKKNNRKKETQKKIGKKHSVCLSETESEKANLFFKIGTKEDINNKNISESTEVLSSNSVLERYDVNDLACKSKFQECHNEIEGTKISIPKKENNERKVKDLISNSKKKKKNIELNDKIEVFPSNQLREIHEIVNNEIGEISKKNTKKPTYKPIEKDKKSDKNDMNLINFQIKNSKEKKCDKVENNIISNKKISKKVDASTMKNKNVKINVEVNDKTQLSKEIINNVFKDPESKPQFVSKICGFKNNKTSEKDEKKYILNDVYDSHKDENLLFSDIINNKFSNTADDGLESFNLRSKIDNYSKYSNDGNKSPKDYFKNPKKTTVQKSKNKLDNIDPCDIIDFISQQKTGNNFKDNTLCSSDCFENITITNENETYNLLGTHQPSAYGLHLDVFDMSNQYQKFQKDSCNLSADNKHNYEMYLNKNILENIIDHKTILIKKSPENFFHSNEMISQNKNTSKKHGSKLKESFMGNLDASPDFLIKRKTSVDTSYPGTQIINNLNNQKSQKNHVNISQDKHLNEFTSCKTEYNNKNQQLSSSEIDSKQNLEEKNIKTAKTQKDVLTKDLHNFYIHKESEINKNKKNTEKQISAYSSDINFDNLDKIERVNSLCSFDNMTYKERSESLNLTSFQKDINNQDHTIINDQVTHKKNILYVNNSLKKKSVLNHNNSISDYQCLYQIPQDDSYVQSSTFNSYCDSKLESLNYNDVSFSINDDHCCKDTIHSPKINDIVNFKRNSNKMVESTAFNYHNAFDEIKIEQMNNLDCSEKSLDNNFIPPQNVLKSSSSIDKNLPIFDYDTFRVDNKCSISNIEIHKIANKNNEDFENVQTKKNKLFELNKDFIDDDDTLLPEIKHLKTHTKNFVKHSPPAKRRLDLKEEYMLKNEIIMRKNDHDINTILDFFLNNLIISETADPVAILKRINVTDPAFLNREFLKKKLENIQMQYSIEKIKIEEYINEDLLNDDFFGSLWVFTDLKMKSIFLSKFLSNEKRPSETSIKKILKNDVVSILGSKIHTCKNWANKLYYYKKKNFFDKHSNLLTSSIRDDFTLSDKENTE